MTVAIGRRELLAALGGAAAAWPLAAGAQQAGKLPTIGFLGANPSIESSRVALKRASASRPSGTWYDDDFDVLCNGEIVGRIMKASWQRYSGAPWLTAR
jgi:hypothetical protein